MVDLEHVRDMLRKRRRLLRLTHHDDIAQHVVSKSEIASDGYEDIDRRSRANAASDDANNASGRAIFDLVEDGEHLRNTS
jgi:hypothetical protein